MPDLRYPLGEFVAETAPDAGQRLELLAQLAAAPGLLRAATADLSESQLDVPYRFGGWTVRQIVHHLADSHLHWYLRTKLALTEEEPVVQPWDGDRWAELADARTAPVESSLLLFEGLHRRWVELLHSLSEEQWKRRLHHPERGPFVLDTALAMHVWHGKHHTTQVLGLRARMGWTIPQ